MAGPKTILLIDDDPEIRSSLQTLLEVNGYRVVTASDGEAGLEAAKIVRPDVIVLDMMMPKKSGLAVLDAVRSTDKEEPKVIMITANGGASHRTYAEFLGADAFINKPFPLETLLANVERLCGTASGPTSH